MSTQSRGADPDDLCPLMLRYLDDALLSEDVATLNDDLRTDQRARREFVELLYEQAYLAELCKEETRGPAELVIQPHLWRRLASSRVWMLAATVAGILAVGWLLVRPRYPAPQISGAVQVVDDEKLRRGTYLRTDDEPGGLALGGYCRVEIEPHSTLLIEGKERHEGMFLKRGGLTCDVEQNKGAFAVRTEVGTVSVTGTEFRVQVFERKGATEMNVKRGLVVLVVAVMAGSVSVEYDGATHGVTAGATQTFTAEKQDETQEATPLQAGGKIVAGKPQYRPKNHEAWRVKGRIVGLLRHAPVCEIDVLDSSGKIVTSTRPKKGAHSYELQWLKPGKYDVRVSARDYQSLELKGLEVKARNDLFMNLEFLPK